MWVKISESTEYLVPANGGMSIAETEHHGSMYIILRYEGLVLDLWTWAEIESLARGSKC
jgi:hypothetical protein